MTDATAGHPPTGAAGSQHAPTVSLRGVGMAFGSHVVLRDVDLDLAPAQVTALLGANGAGKSTLIKVLSGALPGHAGTVAVDGTEQRLATPGRARALGIATVHQRVSEGVVPGLSVQENLALDDLARPPQGRRGWLLRRRQITTVARRALGALELDWPDSVLRRDVATLGISDAQLLVVARALLHRPRLLILDEPTSALSAVEAGRLFDVVHRLREDGLAVVLVSHRLGEVDAIADRAVVLREGRITSDTLRPLRWPVILPAMLGDGAQGLAAAQPDDRRNARALSAPPAGPVAVAVRGARLLPGSGPLDLDLRAGEVTGVVGLIGAGKSELAHGLFGSTPWATGTADITGIDRLPRSPGEAVRGGVFLVPEDRAAQALLPGWSVARTLSLPFVGAVTSRLGVLDAGRERDRASTTIERLGVVTRSPATEVGTLSGGNQQKVVVGRWLVERARVLLLDEPFRGVDLGARRDIGEQARAVAAGGGCVVVLSADVDEVLEVADRVIVLVDGRVSLDSPVTLVSRADVVRAFSGEAAA